MMNPESANKPRNINADWMMLRELAKNERSLRYEGAELSEEERARFQRRGRMLLDIVNRMPDKLDEGVKEEKVEKIYRAAEKAGIRDNLEKTMRKELKSLSIDRVGEETFGKGEIELTEEEEQKVEELREKVVDLTEVAPGALAEEFPSGNYLYHGTTVPKIEKIFQTGGLKNGVALREDDPEINAFAINSGFEGLSWSMNQIDALPGSTGHVAGFLTAPENLLDDSTRLVVPSRPAPYEVLQVSKEINPQELYTTKNQLETWGDGGVSLAEKNSVDGNLMWMLMHKEGDMFFGRSTVYDYDGDTSAEAMRKYFTLDENGGLTWDDDIYQKFEVPPALPWMQSLIDRGIFARNGYENLDSVEKVVEYAKSNQDFIKILRATEKAAVKPIEERYDKMLDDAGAIRVRPEDMYFVTSHGDLDNWLKVMARTGVEPKGILLYDDDQVVLENFASRYEGNHKELSREIGRAVDVNDSFWKSEMDMDPENIPRSGHRGQVLLESAVKRDKVIELDNEGKLEVIPA